MGGPTPVGAAWGSKPRILFPATSLGSTTLPVGEEPPPRPDALAGHSDCLREPPGHWRWWGGGASATHRWFCMETCPFRCEPHLSHHLCPLPATPSSIPQVGAALALSVRVTQCGGMEREAETPREVERVRRGRTDDSPQVCHSLFSYSPPKADTLPAKPQSLLDPGMVQNLPLSSKTRLPPPPLGGVGETGRGQWGQLTYLSLTAEDQ